MDWAAFGLPMEGHTAQVPKASDIYRPDVATCRPTERLGEVRQRTQAAGLDVCLVLNEARVVLGRLRRKAWDAEASAMAESVMENGPATIRPDETLEALVKRMREKNVGSIIVTNPDGVLMGLLYLEDAEAYLNKSPAI
jgi:CBS domain-containing protein